MPSDIAPITTLLKQARAGDRRAANQLMDAVYTDLQAIAHNYFAKERADHTLEPTALVHEAWIKLFDDGGAVDCHDRSHFFAIAACQMRRILVDHGRKFRAAKRGHGLKVALEENLHSSLDGHWEIEEIHDLLDRLYRVDPPAAKTVEMKVFAGMTDAEAAAELGCSQSTVRRHWSFAKAWLVRQLTDFRVRGRN